MSRRHLSNIWKTAVLVPCAWSLAWAMAACGSKAELDKLPDAVPKSADQEKQQPAAEPRGQLVTPPREYYENLFGDALANTDRGAYTLADLDAAQVLWLSFGGLEVPKGMGNGQSFLVCSNMARIPAAALSPAEEKQIMIAVQDAFDRSKLGVNVTLERPSSGAFSTLSIGGFYDDLGCKDSGLFGTAPYDEGNANPRDVAFVFSEGLLAKGGKLDKVEAEAILQAGRAYGVADLAAGVPANKSPGLLMSIPGIATLPMQLTKLPGLAQLAGIAKLLPSLTADNLVDITQLVPAIKALFPYSVKSLNLPHLVRSFTVIALANQAATQQEKGTEKTPTTTPGTPTPTPTTPGVVANTPTFNPSGAADVLNANSLSKISGLASLITGGGSGIANALSKAQSWLDLFGRRTTSAPAMPLLQEGVSPGDELSNLPDLCELLGLFESGSDFGRHLNNYIGTAQVINANYTGVERDALLSLIKVAYAQGYQRLAAATSR